MSMDNEEIKELFGKLESKFEKNIDEGRAEHKEIREDLQEGMKDLGDRMINVENSIDSHILTSDKKAKSKKEKISYVFGAIGIVIAAIALYIKL